MTRIARLLPLVTVAAWVITIALPVLDSGASNIVGITVTSLGESVSSSAVQPLFLLAWVAVLGCAASVWLFRSLTWWSIVAIIVSVLLGVFFVSVLINPPALIWDGVDAEGRGIGGYEIGKPAAGALLWVMGIAALLLSGVCGLVGSTQQGRQRR